MDFKEFKEKYEHKPVQKQPNQVPDKPVVSVCVQTYNHVSYIRECLEGILMQKTDFPMEILLGEDGSTDGTREICIEYAEKYPEKIRLFLHHRENNIVINGSPTGRFNTLNNLFSARGNYIALCEGDDYWTDPLKLQKQVGFLEKNPSYSACFTNAKVVSEGTEKLDRKYLDFEGDVNYTIEDIIKKGGGLFPTASLVFRNIIKKHPNFISKFKSGDRALSLILADKGDFYLLNEVTCIYRRHEGGVFSSIRNNKNVRNEIKLDNINLLKEFNSYSGFKYNKFIKENISRLSKIILLNSNEKFIIPKDTYGVFKELSLKDWFSYLYNKSKKQK